MASPEEPAVAVEEVQDWLSAETVIATVVAGLIVAGLIVIVIALGFRRKREAERVVAREKAAAAKRKAPPPGAAAPTSPRWRSWRAPPVPTRRPC